MITIFLSTADGLCSRKRSWLSWSCEYLMRTHTHHTTHHTHVHTPHTTHMYTHTHHTHVHTHTPHTCTHTPHTCTHTHTPHTCTHTHTTHMYTHNASDCASSQGIVNPVKAAKNTEFGDGSVKVGVAMGGSGWVQSWVLYGYDGCGHGLCMCTRSCVSMVSKETGI